MFYCHKLEEVKKKILPNVHTTFIDKSEIFISINGSSDNVNKQTKKLTCRELSMIERHSTILV